MDISSKRKNYIDLLKTIAVILVFNSHLDKLYPISTLATGGAIGNTLFFFISGYTWKNGALKSSYFNWYFSKVKRIFFPTLITNTIFLIFLFGRNANFLELIKIYIYPNKSWFCGAILLYALFYYFLAHKKDVQLYCFIIICTCLYFFWYLNFVDLNSFNVEYFVQGGLCRVLYYAICMTVGLLFNRQNNYSKVINKRTGLFLSFLFFILFFADKYLMSHYTVFMKMQFLNQAIALILVIILFLTARLFEEYINGSHYFRKFIHTVSDYSWEFYLVQTIVIPFCGIIGFPLNCIAAIVGSAISAWILKTIVSCLIYLGDKLVK